MPLFLLVGVVVLVAAALHAWLFEDNEYAAGVLLVLALVLLVMFTVVA